jgi:hypothetical protein
MTCEAKPMSEYIKLNTADVREAVRMDRLTIPEIVKVLNSSNVEIVSEDYLSLKRLFKLMDDNFPLRLEV